MMLTPLQANKIILNRFYTEKKQLGKQTPAHPHLESARTTADFKNLIKQMKG